MQACLRQLPCGMAAGSEVPEPDQRYVVTLQEALEFSAEPLDRHWCEQPQLPASWVELQTLHGCRLQAWLVF